MFVTSHLKPSYIHGRSFNAGRRNIPNSEPSAEEILIRLGYNKFIDPAHEFYSPALIDSTFRNIRNQHNPIKRLNYFLKIATRNRQDEEIKKNFISY